MFKYDNVIMRSLERERYDCLNQTDGDIATETPDKETRKCIRTAALRPIPKN